MSKNDHILLRDHTDQTKKGYGLPRSGQEQQSPWQILQLLFYFDFDCGASMEGVGADVEDGELGAVAAGGVRGQRRPSRPSRRCTRGSAGRADGGGCRGQGRRGPRGARRDRRRNSATKLFMAVGRGGGRG